MNKDSILEAARNNEEVGYEYENRESVRGNLLSSAIAIIVGLILFLVEFLVKNTINVGLLIIAVSSLATQLIYEGIKVKNYFFIGAGIFFIFADLVLVAIFVFQVVYL